MRISPTPVRGSARLAPSKSAGETARAQPLHGECSVAAAACAIGIAAISASEMPIAANRPAPLRRALRAVASTLRGHRWPGRVEVATRHGATNRNRALGTVSMLLARRTVTGVFLSTGTARGPALFDDRVGPRVLISSSFPTRCPLAYEQTEQLVHLRRQVRCAVRRGQTVLRTMGTNDQTRTSSDASWVVGRSGRCPHFDVFREVSGGIGGANCGAMMGCFARPT